MSGPRLRVQLLVLGLFATGLATSPARCAAPDSSIERQLAPYSKPQRVVRIERERTINFVCFGQGSPTVILTAGLEAWSFWWGAVQRPIAERTRVCAWDRAGYGFSSPSPDPQDILHTTADLERALKTAGIRGPYVMVGHSMGAYESLRFTDLHRESVVGIVLVDPAIPDQMGIEARIAPEFAKSSLANGEQLVTQLEDCARKLGGDTVNGRAPEVERCAAARGVPDVFPHLQASIARLNIDRARLLTQASLNKEFYSGTDSREVTSARRRYGDMPLIVLTGGLDEPAALSAVHASAGTGKSADLEELGKQIKRFLQEAWGPAHDAYAALSTRGRNQLVPDAGHNIQIEKPEVVIAAVVEVLNDIH